MPLCFQAKDFALSLSLESLFWSKFPAIAAYKPCALAGSRISDETPPLGIAGSPCSSIWPLSLLSRLSPRPLCNDSFFHVSPPSTLRYKPSRWVKPCALWDDSTAAKMISFPSTAGPGRGSVTRRVIVRPLKKSYPTTFQCAPLSVDLRIPIPGPPYGELLVTLPVPT